MTSRFLYDDYSDSERGAIIIDGGGKPGGYTQATAATGYAMANLLHHDPYALVKIVGGNRVIDIDLTAAQAANAVAGLGMFGVWSAGTPPAITLWYSSDASSWTSLGTAFSSGGWASVKHRIFPLASAQAARYWRLQVATSDDWYCGKVFLGKYIDFGQAYTPGTTYAKFPPKSRLMTATGLAGAHVLGAVRERFENVYQLITDTNKVAIDTIAASGKPFGYVHLDDVARHVDLESAEGVPMQQLATAESRWSFNVAMISLP